MLILTPAHVVREKEVVVPEGLVFVASMVVALVAASEWARRIVIGGMCAPSTGVGAHDVAVEVPHAPDEIVAIPQWQRDP